MSLKFRRHCSLLVALVLVTLLLIGGLGEQRIVAYSVPGRLQPELIAHAYSSAVAMLD
ncbi:MAG: hypothetical protein JW850_17525 [Thermoflexales bacterium]|nr:hypothetical protein [Thermoflexales bacterium]